MPANDVRSVEMTEGRPNRRAFAALAVGGVAAALLRPGRAGSADAAVLRPVPAIAPLPTLPPPLAYGSPLLDRAKAALDRHRGRVAMADRIGLADFARHSRELRFHLVDLLQGQHWSYLVAHGKGSDPEHTGYLQRFSNDDGSFATSSGSYLTSDIYEGQHGQSMRLKGLDPTNSNAEDRAIVIHGAPYVSEDHVARWGKCGRSEGCLAFAPHRLGEVLALLGPGRLVFADKA